MKSTTSDQFQYRLSLEAPWSKPAEIENPGITARHVARIAAEEISRITGNVSMPIFVRVTSSSNAPEDFTAVPCPSIKTDWVVHSSE